MFLEYLSCFAIIKTVDFLHAFREISVKMLARARELDIFEGKLKIKVLLPEDIIGLKIQAIANNPDRAPRECIDIESLMEQYKAGLDWALLEEYFTLFEQDKKFKELKKKYCNA